MTDEYTIKPPAWTSHSTYSVLAFSPLYPPLLGDKKESLRDTLRLSAGGILHLFF
jgi:hypothetical protein